MREQDKAFVEWLEDYLAWYEKSALRWWIALWACRLLTVLASVVSIIVAAAITPEYFSGVGRWLLVVAGALTAVSTEVLSALRVREMEDLREAGNLEAAAIVAYARQRFDEHENDAERISQLKDEIRGKIENLERSQHRHAVAIDLESAPIRETMTILAHSPSYRAPASP